MTGMLGTRRLQKAIGKRDLQVAYAFNLQETNLIFWISNANPTNRMWKQKWIDHLKTENLTQHESPSAIYFCFRFRVLFQQHSWFAIDCFFLSFIILNLLNRLFSLILLGYVFFMAKRYSIIIFYCFNLMSLWQISVRYTLFHLF